MLTVQRSKRLAFNKYLGTSLILGQSDTLEPWLRHRYQGHSIPVFGLPLSITFSIIPKKVKIYKLGKDKTGRSGNTGLSQ